MKSIRLVASFVILLASAASATVFQPTSDRQLSDRSDAVVVATVRTASSRVRADGYVVTDYRFDVEETVKGSATGTITVSEIGGTAGGRFTFISDSAVYSPGERVLVFLRKRSDGTYLTTSMAMGKFSFSRTARGEAIVTRDVSELRDDPARLANEFKAFVRGEAAGTVASANYTTTHPVLAMSLRPNTLAFPASAYTLGARWEGGESGAIATFFIKGSLSGVPTAAEKIANGLAAWTDDPNAGIVLNGGNPAPNGSSATPNGDDQLNIIYLGQNPSDPLCDGGVACMLGSGNHQHQYKGETFIAISDADIVVSPSVGTPEFQALITHELGHAIGLRHSNQGTPSDGAAIMANPVNASFGSQLQPWDRDANDTVYGNGPACLPPGTATISGGGAVASGQTATLSANIFGGSTPFTYAWYEGFDPDTSQPVGSNSSTFTTPPITGTKNYWVKITNACGSSKASATVFVQESSCVPANIATGPVGQTINSGATATLNVTATGSQPFTYQWYRATSNTDTSNPVGQSSPQFTTPALTQSASFWVKVTNACGNAISSVATVAVATSNCPKPVFSIQPIGGNAVSGSQTYLIAFATGATSYQWYKGNAGDTSTPVTGSGPSNDRWVNQIYIDLLGRSADAASVATYTGLLAGGTPRATVAETVLTSSEYRNRLLTGFYTSFLHRTPSAAEISFWAPAFAANLTDEQIEAQILGSPEYFAIAGGTNTAWLDRVFNDVLGRSPSAADSSAFAPLLASSSRSTVALQILASGEAVNRRVQQYYTRFLRRAATTAESSPFVGAILGGTSDEQVMAQILAADEYFNYGTLLITDAIGATTRYWVRASNSCGTTDSTTAVLTIPQCPVPVINSQPQSVSAPLGTPVTLSVLAQDGATYQWYRASSGDPSNLVGTAPTLTVAPTGVGITEYWVKVFNACGGSANSNTVTVTVSCAPRVVNVTTPPTALSSTSYTVSWNGDPAFDFSYEVQESTNADFTGAQTTTVRGATSATFTHTVTADTRYYYRVHSAPLCGGDFGAFGRSGSTLVTAPQPATQTSFNLARTPCTTQNCKITQPLFIPGFAAAGKTALATGDTYAVTSDEPFITITPSSGALPTEGVTVNVVIETAGLDIGSTQASVTVVRTHAAGKTGAFGDPPATNSVPVSVSVVAPVTQTPKSTNAPLNVLLIPAIAHADGIGTRFVSDVRLTNTAAQSITYQLTYTPANTDGTQVGKQTSITVTPNETKALNDIVKDWYGSGTTGDNAQIGSLEIRPLNYAGKDPVSVSFASVAASRTYSVTPLGTFGQFIPALPVANFLAKSDIARLSLQQVSQSNATGGYRTNLGFIEGAGQPVDFVATLFDDNGNKLAERAYSLKPFESQQIKMDNFFNATGITLPNIADARVEVRVTSDTGRISAYASVLDNTTTDPLLVFPVDPSKVTASRFVVPGIAEFDSSFSNFHSDMRIYNGGTSAVDVTLAFTGANVPNQTKSIAAGGTLAINNVLPTLWGITGGGSVVATTASNAQLVVTARTFSRDKTNGGTFGQFIPGVSAADAVGNGERALQIVQLEESPAFRTNLGLVEVTNNAASVELLAYSPDSKVASKTVVPLAAGQYLQQGQIFKSLGFTNVYNGRITARVIGGTGRIAAYGSVIDNRTTDPTYVPSQ